ncbi:hypothetical protein [Paraclostridium sordellii]|uniref:hypothetical protein n=1 Tax=Paraclostridium sordellii TaxID=1505 RepID=UPI00189BAB46|nr:hypothetical protein [Paeniclostridium sordellii]
MYVTGGAIRNKLLGFDYRDIDLVCIGRSKEDFKENFKGEIRIIADFDNVLIYTVNRVDSFAISFSDSIEEDFYMRDFTVNSFIYNVKASKLYGRAIAYEDIDNKILRPCNRSNLSLITTLRGIRLSTNYNLIPIDDNVLNTLTGVNSKFLSIRLKNELSKHNNPLPRELEKIIVDKIYYTDYFL